MSMLLATIEFTYGSNGDMPDDGCGQFGVVISKEKNEDT